MKKEKEEALTLRERFDATGRSIAKYARAYGLDEKILKYVLDESLSGESEKREGISKVRMCILRLQEDGLWRGALPWKSKDKAT